MGLGFERFGRHRGAAATVFAAAAISGLAYTLWAPMRREAKAREVELAACALETDPTGCRAKVEANSEECFHLTWEFGPRGANGHLDTAAFRDCVRSSPKEWDRKDREERRARREAQQRYQQELRKAASQ